ncbi:MAG: hypothetical protein JST89_20905 [Cyanobacteria bacterium SZAS-4]|nr:hypothetical protein [Cyanobacteria bacterium SZAS-4]
MKNLLVLGFVASLITSAFVGSAALANDADDAAKNARRAEGQEIKAERDAARGDVNGAARHERNARRDEHKSRKEEHRAIRKGETY